MFGVIEMLRGNLVEIRALERDDLPLLHAWWNDPDLMGALGGRRRITSLEETEAWLESEHSKIAVCEGRTFGITSRREGRLIGTLTYGGFEEAHRNVEISVYIGNSTDRSQGYGSEAVGLVADYLFCDVGVHKLRLMVHPDNLQAIGCYKKVGFEEEGRLRQHRFFGGKFHDLLAMSLLEPEWQSRPTPRW